MKIDFSRQSLTGQMDEQTIKYKNKQMNKGTDYQMNEEWMKKQLDEQMVQHTNGKTIISWAPIRANKQFNSDLNLSSSQDPSKWLCFFSNSCFFLFEVRQHFIRETLNVKLSKFQNIYIFKLALSSSSNNSHQFRICFLLNKTQYLKAPTVLTLILMLCVLSDLSLSAFWVFSECSLSANWLLTYSWLIAWRFEPEWWRLTALDKLGPN